jgi:hypothetical protein
VAPSKASSRGQPILPSLGVARNYQGLDSHDGTVVRLWELHPSAEGLLAKTFLTAGAASLWRAKS